jgi:hypothetical protein
MASINHLIGSTGEPTRQRLFITTVVTATLLAALQGGVGADGPPAAQSSSQILTAVLETSSSTGDVGQYWVKEITIHDGDWLAFRWRTNVTTATKGRWEVVGTRGVVLASGEVPAASKGGVSHFYLDFGSLKISPPFKVRIWAVTLQGAMVGKASEPVLVNKSSGGDSITCNTAAELGLPIHGKLESIRLAHNVPALGGAVVTAGGTVYDVVTMLQEYHTVSPAK